MFLETIIEGDPVPIIIRTRVESVFMTFLCVPRREEVEEEKMMKCTDCPAVAFELKCV